MNRVANLLVLFGASLLVVIVSFAWLNETGEPIKVEAPPALSIHPLSGEFSTGYILVEVWTTDGEFEFCHVVRMKRSEYLEWMNQSPEG